MRKSILAVALATAALAWFAPDDDNPVVGPAAAALPAAPPFTPAAHADAAMPPALPGPIPPELHIARRIDTEELGDLFAGESPSAAPLKPAAARVPQGELPSVRSVPSAALPFIFLGSYDDGGQQAFLLQAGGQDIVARIGDTIAGAYRLDRAGDGVLSLTYLPRNQAITLALTDAPGDAN
jgi:hypothetical protein